MIWMGSLVVAVGLGFASLIASETERAARKRLARKYEHADRELRRHNHNIRTHLQDRQQQLAFKERIDAHYASHLAGVAAYSVYKDAITSEKALSRAIDELKMEKQTLKNDLDDAHATVRQEILAQIRAINTVLTQLLADIDLVKQQKDSLKQQAYLLNQQTAQLKLQIRDQCGQGGRNWYARLEQRKQFQAAR